MSRLEEIKMLRDSEKLVPPGMQPSNHISGRDVDWLIQQAERVETIIKHRDDILKANEYLNEQNKRYKQALEKIANRKMSVYLTKDDMLSDFIKIANEAIGVDK